MNALLLLQHVAPLPTYPSPPHTTTTTTLSAAPVISITRNPRPLRAQGRGFGSDARKNEIKIKERDDDDDEEEEEGEDGDDDDDDDDDDDEIAQVVFDRMLRRIAAAVGAPMAAGVGTAWALGVLKSGGAWAAPAWAPFVAVALAFGTSAFGIAYGTLSASWDPAREGSPLGWEEARTNWARLWEDDEDQTQKMMKKTKKKMRRRSP